MGTYETIERLCAIARMQADIIQKQAAVIAQCEIADSVQAELVSMRQEAGTELAKINKEYN